MCSVFVYLGSFLQLSVFKWSKQKGKRALYSSQDTLLQIQNIMAEPITPNIPEYTKYTRYMLMAFS